MARPDQYRKPATQKRDRLPGERCNQATLEIGPGAVSDEAIGGLLEDWIIPMIVEDLIGALIKASCAPNHPAVDGGHL